MAKTKIPNQEIAELLVGAPQAFPKYSTQLINLANRNAQGTRPIIVGQMSELIQQYPGKDFEGPYFSSRYCSITALMSGSFAFVFDSSSKNLSGLFFHSRNF